MGDTVDRSDERVLGRSLMGIGRRSLPRMSLAGLRRFSSSNGGSKQQQQQQNSVWIPPVQRRPRVSDDIEIRDSSQRRQRTVGQHNALLKSMDLVVDLAGYLVPRRKRPVHDGDDEDGDNTAVTGSRTTTEGDSVVVPYCKLLQDVSSTAMGAEEDIELEPAKPFSAPALFASEQCNRHRRHQNNSILPPHNRNSFLHKSSSTATTALMSSNEFILEEDLFARGEPHQQEQGQPLPQTQTQLKLLRADDLRSLDQDDDLFDSHEQLDWDQKPDERETTTKNVKESVIGTFATPSVPTRLVVPNDRALMEYISPLPDPSIRPPRRTRSARDGGSCASATIDSTASGKPKDESQRSEATTITSSRPKAPDSTILHPSHKRKSKTGNPLLSPGNASPIGRPPVSPTDSSLSSRPTTFAERNSPSCTAIILVDDNMQNAYPSSFFIPGITGTGRTLLDSAHPREDLSSKALHTIQPTSRMVLGDRPPLSRRHPIAPSTGSSTKVDFAPLNRASRLKRHSSSGNLNEKGLNQEKIFKKRPQRRRSSAPHATHDSCGIRSSPAKQCALHDELPQQHETNKSFELTHQRPPTPKKRRSRTLKKRTGMRKSISNSELSSSEVPSKAPSQRSISPKKRPSTRCHGMKKSRSNKELTMIPSGLLSPPLSSRKDRLPLSRARSDESSVFFNNPATTMVNFDASSCSSSSSHSSHRKKINKSYSAGHGPRNQALLLPSSQSALVCRSGSNSHNNLNKGTRRSARRLSPTPSFSSKSSHSQSTATVSSHRHRGHQHHDNQ